MKRLIIPIFLGSALFLLTGCNHDDDDPGLSCETPTLGITEAKALVATEAVSGSLTNLYKITADDRFEPVAFINEDGEPCSSDTIRVTNMTRINSNYWLLSGSFRVLDDAGISHTYTSLIVSKSSGKFFDFPGNDIALDNSKFGGKPIRYDGAGNIYYSNGAGVVRLTIGSDGLVTKESYVPDSEGVNFFDVDANGNCLYQNNEVPGYPDTIPLAPPYYPTTYQIRMKKAGANIEEVVVRDSEGKIVNTNYRDFWVGTNGKIYMLTFYRYYRFYWTIYTVENIGNSLQYQPAYSGNTFSAPTPLNICMSKGDGFYKINGTNSVVFIGLTEGSFWQYHEETRSAEYFTLPPGTGSVVSVTSSPGHAYLATEDRNLYRIPLSLRSDQNFIPTLTQGDFDVYMMAVDKADVLFFSATRTNDGRKVIAKHTPAGMLNVYTEAPDRRAMAIEVLE